MSPSPSFPRGIALLASLSVLLAACKPDDPGLAGVRGCTVDTECGGDGWCQDSQCQVAYLLTLTATGTARADGKYHVNGSLPLSVQVANGSPASVEIQVDGSRVQLVGPPYAWTWTPGITADGDHVVRAVARPGSRVYVSNEVGAVVDHAAPAAPVVGSVASPTRSVTLAGTAEGNATLKVYEGGAVLRTAEVAAGGAFSMPMTGLADGTHTLSITATDWAGNESGPAPLPAITVDTVAPAAPVIDRIPGAVATTSLTITGTAEAGSTVQLVDQGTPVGARATSSAAATWSIALTLANGDHVLTATATDGAGNVSAASAAASFTVSTAGVTIEGPTLTNQSNVTFTGIAPAGLPVQVTDGGVPVASVTAAANATWTAAITLAEGPHDLVAHVSTLASATLHVVVDQTRPQIASRTPAPGTDAARNVDWRTPITVQFTEAMAPATMTSQANVALTAGGISVAKTLTASPDGTTLTIRLSAPPTADEVTVALAGQLGDVAGNGIDPTSWTLSMPEWIDLGSASTLFAYPGYLYLRVTVDPVGRPTVAAAAGSSSGIARWTAAGWVSLEQDVGSGIWWTGCVGDLAVDELGRLAVVRDRQRSAQYSVTAARESDSGWAGNAAPVYVASQLTSACQDSGARALAGGQMDVAFAQQEPAGTYTLYAYHWDGTGWAQLGGGPLATTNSYGRGIQVFRSPAGPPSATWWQGDGIYAWTQGGTPSLRWGTPSLGAGGQLAAFRVDEAMASPVVLASDGSGAVTGIFVLQHRCPPGGLSCWSPTYWYRLGGSGVLNVNAGTSATDAALALDGLGLPVVAWNEAGQLYAKRWTGSEWHQLGSGSINGTAAAGLTLKPFVGVGSGGHVVVAWMETGFRGASVYAKRHNR